MYNVLDKDMIEMEIVPFIPRTKRGFPPTVPLADIVNAMPLAMSEPVAGNQNDLYDIEVQLCGN